MRFVYIGVKNDNEDYVNDKIKIFNFQNLMSIVNLIYLTVLQSIIGHREGALGSAYLMIGAIIGTYFIKIHLYTFAKVFSFVLYNLSILGYIIYFSHPALDYFYLPILVALPMNFHHKESKILLFLIILTLSLFIIGISPLSVYIPKLYTDKNFENPTLAVLVILILFVTYIVGLVITFVIYTNISHNRLRKTSERLIKSRKKLMQQNQDIQDFGLASSQFIKSPIYVLNLFTDKIEKEIKEGKKIEDLKEYFNILQDSITNEEIFIDNLFDYNKIITSTANYEKFNLKSFLEEILNEYEKLSFEIYAENIMISTDKVLLRKIVITILENAFNYNSNPEPKINIYTTAAAKTLSIYFDDNGIGILDEFKEKIFEPFTRVNEIKNINGTGLGLTKAKKAAEIINANLSLFESSNKGSVFKLTLNHSMIVLEKNKKEFYSN